MHQTRERFRRGGQGGARCPESRKVGMRPDVVAFRVVTFARQQGQQRGGMRGDKTSQEEFRLVRGQVERGALEQVLGRLRHARIPDAREPGHPPNLRPGARRRRSRPRSVTNRLSIEPGKRRMPQAPRPAQYTELGSRFRRGPASRPMTPIVSPPRQQRSPERSFQRCGLGRRVGVRRRLGLPVCGTARG